MEFRPCIDIHNGKVKQIIGASLTDADDAAKENFISACDSTYYSNLYYEKGLRGGHVILLNAKDSPYYESTKRQAAACLAAHPGFLQVGGGICADNAAEFLDFGASHVIVTSYVFKDGMINYDNLNRLKHAVGADKIVLDVSCKRTQRGYMVVTDRWQKMTDTELTPELLEHLSAYCDEFLVHAADVEGKMSGIEENLVCMLSEYSERPATYAGGVADYGDIQKIKELGHGRINVTVGSALTLFGGNLSMDRIISIVNS